MSNAADAIHIEELELSAQIGVTDQERSNPRPLSVSITLWPATAFSEMRDDLTKTVNYSALAREVQQFVRPRRDKLIETLADAIAAHLLQAFPLTRVKIELRKFVLAEAKFVAAICERSR